MGSRSLHTRGSLAVTRDGASTGNVTRLLGARSRRRGNYHFRCFWGGSLFRLNTQLAYMLSLRKRDTDLWWYPASLFIGRWKNLGVLATISPPRYESISIQSTRQIDRSIYSQAIHSKANSGPDESSAQRSRDNRASKRSPALGGRKVYRYIKVELDGHEHGEDEKPQGDPFMKAITKCTCIGHDGTRAHHAPYTHIGVRLQQCVEAVRGAKASFHAAASHFICDIKRRICGAA